MPGRAELSVNPVKSLVLLILRAYKRFLSPMLGTSCRFYPSCSSYAMQAVERFGVLRGGWLAIRRIARCHPLSPGGVDPVPEHLPHDCDPRSND